MPKGLDTPHPQSAPFTADVDSLEDEMADDLHRRRVSGLPFLVSGIVIVVGTVIALPLMLSL